MAAIQGEHGLVIEIPHSVNTVMALEAAATQLNLVLKQINLVIECMASEAGLLCKFIFTFLMAALAGNYYVVKIHLVQIKVEACVGIMVKCRSLEIRRSPGIGIMAGCTIHTKHA